MTRTILLLVALLAAACSSRSSDDAGAASDGSTPDLGALDGAAPLDAAPPDGGRTDAGTGVDASRDASVPASSPPAGYTLCGAGAFTGAEAMTACGTAPTIGTLPYASACGGAACTGGRWEIWCPPASGTYLYFWAELDGVTTPGTLCAVMFDGGTLPLTVYGSLGGGRGESHTGASGGAGDLMPTHGTFLGGAPTTVLIEGQLGLGMVGATGTLQVWVPFTPDTCPGTTGGLAPRYVLGITASWGTVDL